MPLLWAGPDHHLEGGDHVAGQPGDVGPEVTRPARVELGEERDRETAPGLEIDRDGHDCRAGTQREHRGPRRDGGRRAEEGRRLSPAEHVAVGDEGDRPAVAQLGEESRRRGAPGAQHGELRPLAHLDEPVEQLRRFELLADRRERVADRRRPDRPGFPAADVGQHDHKPTAPGHGVEEALGVERR